MMIITKMLHYLLSLNGEPKKLVIKKIVDYRLRLLARNGSGFDTWIILNKSTCERSICEIITSGKGNISMKTFNGFVFIDKNKSEHQYILFICRKFHGICSFKKIGITFKLQKDLFSGNES